MILLYCEFCFHDSGLGEKQTGNIDEEIKLYTAYFHTEVFQSEEKKAQSQQTKYNPPHNFHESDGAQCCVIGERLLKTTCQGFICSTEMSRAKRGAITWWSPRLAQI